MVTKNARRSQGIEECRTRNNALRYLRATGRKVSPLIAHSSQLLSNLHLPPAFLVGKQEDEEPFRVFIGSEDGEVNSLLRRTVGFRGLDGFQLGLD